MIDSASQKGQENVQFWQNFWVKVSYFRKKYLLMKKNLIEVDDMKIIKSDYVSEWCHWLNAVDNDITG